MKKTRIKQLENYVFKNIKNYKISESRKSVFLFSFFHSKLSELRKISYDVTI